MQVQSPALRRVICHPPPGRSHAHFAEREQEPLLGISISRILRMGPHTKIAHTHTHTHIQTQTHTHTYTNTQTWCYSISLNWGAISFPTIYTHTHTHTHTQIQIQTHTYTNTQIIPNNLHLFPKIYIHTHTPLQHAVLD